MTSAAIAVRRHLPVHAAVVHPAEAVGRRADAVRRRAAVRPARPRRRRHRRRRLRQRRRRGHLLADDADRRADHRRRRARCRGARRNVPLHVAVAGTDVADRARPLARRRARRRRHDRPGDRCRCRRSPARSSSAGPAFIAAAVGAVSYVALFIAIGCITQRTAVWSLAIVFLIERLLGAALTGIAQISPTWESRAIFVGLLDDPPDRLVRDGIPQGWAAVVRLAIVTAVVAGDRQLADEAHQALRRQRLTDPPLVPFWSRRDHSGDRGEDECSGERRLGGSAGVVGGAGRGDLGPDAPRSS